MAKVIWIKPTYSSVIQTHRHTHTRKNAASKWNKRKLQKHATPNGMNRTHKTQKKEKKNEI